MKKICVFLTTIAMVCMAGLAQAVEVGDTFQLVFSKQVLVANIEPIQQCIILKEGTKSILDKCKIIHTFGDDCLMVPEDGRLSVLAIHENHVLLEYRDGRNGDGFCFSGEGPLAVRIVLELWEVEDMQRVAEGNMEQDRKEKEELSARLKELKEITKKLHSVIPKK